MYHDCTLQPKSRARTNLSTWGAWRRATSTVACFSNKSDKSPQSSNKNLTLCISRTYMSHGWQVSAPLALHRTLSSILYDVVGAEITESKMDFIDFPHWKFGFMNSIQDWSWTELTTRSNQPLLTFLWLRFPFPSSPPRSISPSSAWTSTVTELVLNYLFTFISPRSAIKNKHY